MTTQEQYAWILENLRRGPVTTMHMIHAGIIRGAARVHELRQPENGGHNIINTAPKGQVAVYELVPAAEVASIS